MATELSSTNTMMTIAHQHSNSTTDKVKVAVRIRPFSRRGKILFQLQILI